MAEFVGTSQNGCVVGVDLGLLTCPQPGSGNGVANYSNAPGSPPLA